MNKRKPKLAVWKFASCDGCQLSLLNCEDELITISEKLEISHFLEATSSIKSGPYDLSLIEGSISTPEHLRQIIEVREQSKYLVTIGACATSGGVQALRNFKKLDSFLSIVYAKPNYIDSLEHSTPVSQHVAVDFELQGCPINKEQLLEVISAFLSERRPNIRADSVCAECKRNGAVCVMIAQGTACLGPVTHAGCGALCPTYARGCYACYGPKENPNCDSLKSELVQLGKSEEDAVSIFKSFHCWKEPFRSLGEGPQGEE